MANLRDSIVRAIAIATCAIGALANGVVIVGRTPSVRYADIQSAIDAAVDGEFVLVADGRYAGFAIAGKAVSVFAAPGALIQIDGKIELRNLPSGRSIVIDGLNSDFGYEDNFANATPALRIANCAGDVRVQNCVLHGVEPTATIEDPGPGALIVSSARVAFTNCTLLGGRGGQACGAQGCGDGVGLDAQSSTIVIYDSALLGGRGFDDSQSGKPGGDACTFVGGVLFAANSTIRGGDGGYGNGGSFDLGSDGGNGVTMNGSNVLFFDTQRVGGISSCGLYQCGNDGAPVAGIGNVTNYSGDARSMQAAPSVVDDHTSTLLEVTGHPGDRIFEARSTRLGFLSSPALSGWWLVAQPTAMLLTPLATLTSSATVELTSHPQSVATSKPAQLIERQGFVIGGIQRFLATPSAQLVLRRAAAPDCDGNGVMDVLDVLDGNAPDENGDLIPDGCESLTTWYVDPNASSGGSGSSGSPFQTIAQGVAAASDGDIVRLRDGVYTGASNREIDLVGKQITIASQNGAANCVIDCQSLGRAFLIRTHESRSTVIRGLSIRNGHAASTYGYGGALWIQNASPRIVDCTFDSCQATFYGGALELQSSRSIIDGCTFHANSATSLGGAIDVLDSQVVIRGSTFDSNHSNFGGALASRSLLGGGVITVVAGSSFVSNTASGGGGAITDTTYSPLPLQIDDCLFAGNSAPIGGAIDLTFWGSTITNSTFVGNSATTGGALRAGTTTVANSVFWNDSASHGSEIDVSVQLDISYCDVQGGQSGVKVEPYSTLDWLAGNIAVDPEFVDPDGADNDPSTFADNNYRLQPTSPCIDAGDNDSIATDAADVDGNADSIQYVPIDLNHKPRRRDLPSVPDTGHGTAPIVDLGCYERQS